VENLQKVLSRLEIGLQMGLSRLENGMSRKGEWGYTGMNTCFRPAGEALDELISDFFGEENAAAGKDAPKPSIFGNIQSTVQSLQRFAKQLSQ
jgi:hypothetical protein